MALKFCWKSPEHKTKRPRLPNQSAPWHENRRIVIIGSLITCASRSCEVSVSIVAKASFFAPSERIVEIVEIVENERTREREEARERVRMRENHVFESNGPLPLGRTQTLESALFRPGVRCVSGAGQPTPPQHTHARKSLSMPSYHGIWYHATIQ